jgi:hypothetical protein
MNAERGRMASAAVEALYRSDWGRIVATLIGLVGDFDLAAEAPQSARRGQPAGGPASFIAESLNRVGPPVAATCACVERI